MLRVELVFFGGCPGVGPAKTALREAGVLEYAEIDQDQLPQEHPFRRLSSPSILVNGKLVSGSANCASACSLTNWESVVAELRQALTKA